MIKPVLRPFSVLLLLFLTNITVFASTFSPSKNTQISASAEYMYLKHENYDEDGFVVNSEDGFIPGFGISLISTSRKMIGGFSLEMYSGSTDFTAELSDGFFESRTTQRLSCFSYHLKTNMWRRLFQFYGVASFNDWQRDIAAKGVILNLERRYQWWSLEVGTQLNIDVTRDDTLSAEIGVSRTVFSEMQMDLSQSNLGKPLFKLQDKFGLSVKLSFKHMFNKKHGGNLFANAKYWQFGPSNTRTINNNIDTITIKESESQSLATAFGATYFYLF